jgi:hypothetical protein
MSEAKLAGGAPVGDTPVGGGVYERPQYFPIDTRPEAVRQLATALKSGEWHTAMLDHAADTLLYLMAERDGTLRAVTTTVVEPG